MAKQTLDTDANNAAWDYCDAVWTAEERRQAEIQGPEALAKFERELLDIEEFNG